MVNRARTTNQASNARHIGLLRKVDAGMEVLWFDRQQRMTEEVMYSYPDFREVRLHYIEKSYRRTTGASGARYFIDGREIVPSPHSTIRSFEGWSSIYISSEIPSTTNITLLVPQRQERCYIVESHMCEMATNKVVELPEYLAWSKRFKSASQRIKDGPRKLLAEVKGEPYIPIEPPESEPDYMIQRTNLDGIFLRVQIENARGNAGGFLHINALVEGTSYTGTLYLAPSNPSFCLSDGDRLLYLNDENVQKEGRVPFGRVVCA